MTWFNSRFDHTHKHLRKDMPSRYTDEGVAIELLDALGYKRNVSLARVRDQAYTARAFARRARELVKPDIILCSLPTLELCREAVRYGRENNVAVLLDVRDLWPDVYYRSVPEPMAPLLLPLLAPQERLANSVLSNADGIVGISPKYLEWGLRRARRERQDSDAIIPLGYEFAPLSEDERSEGTASVARLNIFPDRPIVWYVGTFGMQYDLAPVIEAARRFDTSERGPMFVLSGAGELEGRWRKQAEGLSNVVFTGWITRPELGWLRENACIGLQPYANGAPQGLANKTFEYLSAGLPIVSSLQGENGDLLETTKTGLVYQPGNATECYAAIKRLLDDPAMRDAYAKNGLAVYQDQYSSAAVFGALEQHLAFVSRKRAL